MDKVVVSSSSALRALSGVRACAQLAPPRLLHARRAVPAGLVDALWRDAIVTRHSMPGRAFCGPARRRLSLASLPSENGPEEAHVSACIPPLSIVNSPVFLAFRLIPSLDKSHVSDWRNRMSGTSSFTQKCRFAHFKRSITDLQVCCIERCSPYRGLPV